MIDQTSIVCRSRIDQRSIQDNLQACDADPTPEIAQRLTFVIDDSARPVVFIYTLRGCGNLSVCTVRHGA